MCILHKYSSTCDTPCLERTVSLYIEERGRYVRYKGRIHGLPPRDEVHTIAASQGGRAMGATIYSFLSSTIAVLLLLAAALGLLGLLALEVRWIVRVCGGGGRRQ